MHSIQCPQDLCVDDLPAFLDNKLDLDSGSLPNFTYPILPDSYTMRLRVISSHEPLMCTTR
jgi:hypothetical protein